MLESHEYGHDPVTGFHPEHVGSIVGPMLTAITIRRFKCFLEQRFELADSLVLAGPNNAGKTTLLQALATWHLALKHWHARRPSTSRAKDRYGVVMTRQQFTAIPLREMNLLWEGRQVSGKDQEKGGRRRIELIVEGNDDGGWSCGLELDYGSPENIFVRPLGAKDGDLTGFPPQQSTSLTVVHMPPFSGIAREEPLHDRPYQDFLIGQGRPGEVLRNLLLDVSKQPEAWKKLSDDVRNLFEIKLLTPEYGTGTPHIIAEYDSPTCARPLDLANAGSGFLQVVTLLAFFHGREGSVLLVDEPDAHQHVILQKEVYDLLRTAAARRNSQLFIATHSEVVLDRTSPERVVSFAGRQPRRLANKSERDRLREAMKRLTTTDLLLADEKRGVLYVESETDERILARWAEILDHPAKRFLRRPYVHRLGGNSLREARSHHFALRLIDENLRGLVILDGDGRDIETVEPGDAEGGLAVARWSRYEIENYLLVPRAIAAVAPSAQEPLFHSATIAKVEDMFYAQIPRGADLFGDLAALRRIKASEDLIPQLLEVAGNPLPKTDYYLIAAAMQPHEIHPEVVTMLDRVVDALRPTEAQHE
jgi:AAA domain, putative AbiEii toxin, Type IV TA system